jgi:hypothetical protein
MKVGVHVRSWTSRGSRDTVIHATKRTTIVHPVRRLGMTAPARRLPILLVTVLAVAVGVFLTGLHWSTQRSIDRWVRVAYEHHAGAGDDVDALMAFVLDDTHTLDDRNHAVWTLGRIGDERAVPLLESCLTGEDCDHAHALCQREIRKALARCGEIDH